MANGTKIEGDELKFFLLFCKAVREYQNHFGGNGRDIKYHITNVWRGHDFGVKKLYALAYSLEQKGFVKINNKKCISLDSRGIDYIQYLKSKR